MPRPSLPTASMAGGLAVQAQAGASYRPRIPAGFLGKCRGPRRSSLTKRVLAGRRAEPSTPFGGAGVGAADARTVCRGRRPASRRRPGNEDAVRSSVVSRRHVPRRRRSMLAGPDIAGVTVHAPAIAGRWSYLSATRCSSRSKHVPMTQTLMKALPSQRHLRGEHVLYFRDQNSGGDRRRPRRS